MRRLGGLGRVRLLGRRLPGRRFAAPLVAVAARDLVAEQRAVVVDRTASVTRGLLAAGLGAPGVVELLRGSLVRIGAPAGRRGAGAAGRSGELAVARIRMLSVGRGGAGAGTLLTVGRLARLVARRLARLLAGLRPGTVPGVDELLAAARILLPGVLFPDAGVPGALLPAARIEGGHALLRLLKTLRMLLRGMALAGARVAAQRAAGLRIETGLGGRGPRLLRLLVRRLRRRVVTRITAVGARGAALRSPAGARFRVLERLFRTPQIAAVARHISSAPRVRGSVVRSVSVFQLAIVSCAEACWARLAR
ncbi:hypothetical protein GCM10009838_13790 [Catenulispora subtropica]|uniref:Uncharacterized protein n=1 Tax=Catenulispora subtropica TaxID=450798 RepID=A0ABN2QVH4_9ACTN